MICDQHIHTTISDGSDTFESVLYQAKKLGIAAVTFTNHDTTRGLDEAIRAGEAIGIRVEGGIEVSAWDPHRERKVHVLGMGLAERSPALESLCSPVLQARDANSRWQMDRLLDAGYELDVERVETLAARSTALYKQHIMAGLTDAPHGSGEYACLYRSLFKAGGICDRDIAYVDARDAVRAIIEDGGRAVLAHPGQLDSYEFVPELVACGLSGIELYHPDHDVSDHARCLDLAQRFNLECSAGSDYHGRFGAVSQVGYGIPASPLSNGRRSCVRSNHLQHYPCVFQRASAIQRRERIS